MAKWVYLLHIYLKRFQYLAQVDDSHVPLTNLDKPNVGPVKTAQLSELLLGPPPFLPDFLDPGSEGSQEL